MYVVGRVSETGEWSNLLEDDADGVTDGVGYGSLGADAAGKEVVAIVVQRLTAGALGVAAAPRREGGADRSGRMQPLCPLPFVRRAVLIAV